MSGFDPVGIIWGIIEKIVTSPIFQIGLKAIVAYLVLAWFATAIWAYNDARGRIRNPILALVPPLILVASTPLGFIPLAILYRLVRPAERVTERLEREYAVEALLREVELSNCPRCGRPTERDWRACPTCANPLRRECPACKGIVDVGWRACAWCGGVLAPVAEERPRRGLRRAKDE